MNHPLFLALDQTTPSSPGLRFSLLMRNDSSVKLLLPYPEITGLHFRKNKSGVEAEWYTHLFVSAGGSAWTLEPGQTRQFDFRVRTSELEPEPNELTDYSRWYIELKPGSFTVSFPFKVDSDYFDPDSHWRLPQLEGQARQEEAIVWLGKTSSNHLGLLRDITAVDHWPTAVARLAEALYEGENCSFALHDALLEAGHSDLAEHFGQQQWHAQNCRVLDWILGKQ